MPNKPSPITCQECGSEQLIHIIEGLTLRNIFSWNERRGRYELEQVKDNSFSNSYLICSNGHRFDEDQEEVFQRLAMKNF